VNKSEALLVEVHPGTGLVSRHEDSLLVIPSLGPDQWPRARQLVAICQRELDPTRRIRARAVAALLTEAEPDEVPGFALMLGLAQEVTVIAHGSVDVTVRGTNQESFSGADSLAWVERRVLGPLAHLTVVATGRRPADNPVPVPFHLEGGIVPGGGVTVHRADPTGIPQQAPGELSAAAGQTKPPASGPARPQPHPAPAEPIEPVHPSDVAVTGDLPGSETIAQPVQKFESVLLGDPQAEEVQGRSPLPVANAGDQAAVPPQQPGSVLVEGIECANGHFNRPDAKFCAHCSVPLDQRARRLKRSRPALGLLVTDDGSVFALTTDYVIGRAPERDGAVLSGKARPLVLADAEHSVSRVHAYVTLSGWQVQLTDGGSSNGTSISRGGSAGPWTPVATDRPTALTPGTRLRIGNRQLLFDSYHETTAARTGR
jgi:hypothetical protein